MWYLFMTSWLSWLSHVKTCGWIAHRQEGVIIPASCRHARSVCALVKSYSKPNFDPHYFIWLTPAHNILRFHFAYLISSQLLRGNGVGVLVCGVWEVIVNLLPGAGEG